MQRRRGEEEFVDVIVSAILRQLFKIKNLAMEMPIAGLPPNATADWHPWSHWAHLAAPGIGADRRDVFFTNPVAGLERKSGASPPA